MALRAKNILIDKTQLIDALVIFKPIFDVRDAKGKNKIRASMLPDGDGIVVTEPTLPTFMMEMTNEMHALEGEDNGCVPTYQAHRVAVTDIKKSAGRQTKEVVLRFPDGIRCKMEHFNGKKDGLKLSNNLRILPGELGTGGADTTFAYIFWKLPIDEKQRLLQEEAEDSDDDLDEALLRMSKMSVTK
jgi:hypothetical protein